jgi:anaerobic ribonucleoside-triphosphate reductase
MQTLICHDCGKQLKKGEKYMPYEVSGQAFAKCEVCYQADPALRNFQEAEVYSRVVGYIRPVKQWNKGKQEEFKGRLTFAASSCGC